MELDITKERISDKWKRDFFKKPENGQLHIFNRPFLFTNSNAFTHANDIYQIIKQKQVKPRFLALTCDNGPDFSPQSYLVFFMFWDSYGKNYS